MKLSAAGLKKLCKAGGKRVDYRDESRPGLVLRVMPTGTASWAILYSFRGEDRRYTIGRVKLDDNGKGFTLGEAWEEARILLGQVARGVDPQAAKMAERRAAPARPTLTVAEVSRKAMAALTLRPTTRKEWQRLVDREIVPALGDEPAATLPRGRIREWARERAAEAHGGYTANRAFEVLRRVYTWGVAEDLLPGTPFVGLQRPAQEQRSDRVLTVQELRALLVGLDLVESPYSDAVRLLLLTAARREMVLGASRGELQLAGDEPTWVVPGGPDGRSKSGDAHVIPLSKTAVAIMKRRLEAVEEGELLFPRARPRRLGEPSKRDAAVWSSRFTRELQAEVGIAWATATGKGIPMKKVRREGKMVEEVDRAKARELVPRWTLHNLRHTIATHLRERLRVSADVVSLLLSHTPEGPRVTRTYLRAKLLPERRAALEAWEGWLETLREDVGRVLTGAFGVGTGSEPAGGTQPNRDEPN
jgi:integrase